MSKLIETMSAAIDALLPELEAIYKDLHAHPELSMQEFRTAGIVADDFRQFGSEWDARYSFWFIGGTDPDLLNKAIAAKKLNEIPNNHSPKFAPVLNPMLCAAGAWLDQHDKSL